ncbi:MAG: hypothetical protein JXE07_08495, partial [Candidatus Aminicenantes bacterium]|nr:hypothetical protein [Candidatus Aminicenantes bacterium]
TSVETINVPEGSTATFQVHLSAQPSTDVNVTVSRASGDADISVQSGAALIFTTANWNADQPVTLAAAEDPDISNGSATIRLSATGVPNKDIPATEQDNDTLHFITSVGTVNVPEGDTAVFQVRLSAQPSATVNATVSRVSGDADITVQSGAALTFTTANWDTNQPVTLAAAEDPDISNGSATIRVAATGVPNEDVTATEQDDDIDNGTISLVLDPSLSPAGTLFEAAVEISQNAETMAVFGLDLIYSTEFFKFINSQPGTLTGNWTITVDSSTAGLLKIMGTGGTVIPESSAGSLVKIIFQVNCLSYATPTETTLWLDNYTDDLEDEFLPVPCDSDFTFEPCGWLGDVNNDGNITPGDAQSAFEIYLGRITPTLCQTMTSDANCSLGTTPGDAQDIFEHYLGITTLPLCCAMVGAIKAEIVSSNQFSVAKETKVRVTGRDARPSKSPRLTDEAGGRRAEPRSGRIIYVLDTIGSSGQVVNIPVIVSNPRGLRSFAFDVLYPADMLGYLETQSTVLTREFDYVLGVEETPGLIHIEAESQEPIPIDDFGGLAILTFQVKEGAELGLPLHVLNPFGDLATADLGEGMFFRSETTGKDLKWVSLGNPEPAADSLVRIPVHLNDLFGLKAFGLELRFGVEQLTFIRVRQPDSEEGFVDFQAEEIEPGRLRIGGFRMSEDLRRGPGLLVELVFKKKSGGGEINLEAFVDDLSTAVITRGSLRLD